MFPPDPKPPTYEVVIAEILGAASGPIPAREVAERILAARPSTAKNPLQAARSHIRQAVGRELVFLDGDMVLPLRLAMQGARFRLPLDRKLAQVRLLDIGSTLPSYLPPRFPLERMRFLDSDGQPVVFEIKTVSERVETHFGDKDITIICADLRAWFAREKVYVKDSVLFTIVDWEQGVFQLERERFGDRDPDLLGQRNRLLADLFFELLESVVNEDIQMNVAVPTVYARLPDKSGYPPDHWMVVLDEDERMAQNNWSIRYTDGDLSPMERLDSDLAGMDDFLPPRQVSKEEGEEVFRFRAARTRSPSHWREIEVQGKQTLADLDQALRNAFDHDDYDHLGGFWRLVARGAPAKSGATRRGAAARARYREVELGVVEPMGGGEGAEVQVATLGLAVGDQLKYVYDFGDWIEHRLTLEAVEKPQAGAKYPREVARGS